jgi:hypothetical protein
MRLRGSVWGKEHSIATAEKLKCHTPLDFGPPAFFYHQRHDKKPKPQAIHIQFHRPVPSTYTLHQSTTKCPSSLVSSLSSSALRNLLVQLYVLFALYMIDYVQ